MRNAYCFKEHDHKLYKCMGPPPQLHPDEKINSYLNVSYSGLQLMEKHKLHEHGIWQVFGREDPNCDLGGSHHQLELGIFEGTLREVLEIAFKLSQWASWGGGNIVKYAHPQIQRASDMLIKLNANVKVCPACGGTVLKREPLDKRYTCSKGHQFEVTF